ncbi:MAG: hypothetical protein FWE33_06790 [Defluviitaleaceae bacterium]|nr:hypothetical protein [Defluviitaleaceae bacterium]
MEIYNNNRKIVLLKGDKNKCYEQAIFILRPQMAAGGEIDFVKEAERIINGESLQQKLAEKYGASNPNYLQKEVNKKDDGRPPKRNLDAKLNVALVITGLVLISVFLYSII